MRLSNVLLILILFSTLAVVPAAQAQLSEADREKRISAAWALLENGNIEEQGVALGQLVQFELQARQGVPLFQAHLLRRMKTLPEALAITHAVEGLAAYGTKAQSTLPDLIRLLDEVGSVPGEANFGGRISGHVVMALSRIGPDDPQAIEALKRTLRRCLESPERLSTLLEGTATALSRMGRAAHSATPLLTLALNRCPEATPQLVSALSHMMPEGGLAVPALLRALEAGRSQEAVVEALGNMGSAAKSALPTLHRILELPSPLPAAGAFAAIARIEGLPKLTLADSLPILRHIEAYRLPETYAAFAAVKQESSRALAAVPLLTQIALKRKEPWLRRTAVETLAVVGPGGYAEAARVLLQAAHKQDPVIAMDVDQALEAFGSAAGLVTPELSALLQSNDNHLLERVEMLLVPLGKRAALAVPNLVRLLLIHDQGKQQAGSLSVILSLLSNIGPEAQEAVPVLTDLLLQSSIAKEGVPGYSRVALLTTLMAIGVTPRVLPTLREMLQSTSPTQVACAAHAIARIAPEAGDTIPLLLRPLRTDYDDRSMTKNFALGYTFDTSARIESMRALARFGPAAREALPLLQPYADFHESGYGRQYRQILLKQEAEQAISAIRQTKE
ncbi:MAG: hypothetical protein JWN14_1386 [Chthonomonadales bacterium]|nr:hypothetical protein [Chthonomonadales bacterium]